MPPHTNQPADTSVLCSSSYPNVDTLIIWDTEGGSPARKPRRYLHHVYGVATALRSWIHGYSRASEYMGIEVDLVAIPGRAASDGGGGFIFEWFYQLIVF